MTAECFYTPRHQAAVITQDACGNIVFTDEKLARHDEFHVSAFTEMAP